MMKIGGKTMAVAIFEKQGDTLNIMLESRLDAIRTPQMDKELEPYLVDTQHVLMDFSKVEYVSSSGLRLLLWLVKQMEKRGGKVDVIHVNDDVMKIFETTGFLAVVNVIND